MRWQNWGILLRIHRNTVCNLLRHIICTFLIAQNRLGLTWLSVTFLKSLLFCSAKNCFCCNRNRRSFRQFWCTTRVLFNDSIYCLITSIMKSSVLGLWADVWSCICRFICVRYYENLTVIVNNARILNFFCIPWGWHLSHNHVIMQVHTWLWTVAWFFSVIAWSRLRKVTVCYSVCRWFFWVNLKELVNLLRRPCVKFLSVFNKTSLYWIINCSRKNSRRYIVVILGLTWLIS